jgi:hypothetical protein
VGYSTIYRRTNLAQKMHWTACSTILFSFKVKEPTTKKRNETKVNGMHKYGMYSKLEES